MRRPPAILPVIMLLTSVILILLTGAGLVSAVRHEGHLPDVSIEYASRHLPLLSPANVEAGIADLAIAAQLDFDSPEASSRLAQAAEQAENPAALVLALRGFLANDRDDPELHAWLAAALLAAGDLDSAIVHANETLRLQPDSIQGLVTRADVLTARGQLDEAQHDYERALKLAPQSVLAEQGLQRLKRQTGSQQ